MLQVKTWTKIQRTMRVVILCLFLIVFLLPQAASGDVLDDKRRELDEIQRQIDEQQESLNQKKKERQSLQNQVAIMNGQIRQTELSIQGTQSEIDLTQAEIEIFTKQIKQKEKELAYQKEVLNEAIRVIYEETDEDFLEVLFSSNNISDLLDRTEYLGAIENKIEVTMVEIREIKAELAANKKEQEKKKEELAQKKSELEARKMIIVDQRATRANVLAVARGMESEYRRQLIASQVRAESVQAFITAYYEMMRNEYAGGVASGDLVIQNNASFHFYQTDSRWNGYQYDSGCNDCTIGKYGCLITSLTMVAKFYGNSTINPIVMASGLSFSNGYLLWWPIIAGRGRQSTGWSGADLALSQGRIVVAHVTALSHAGHWIVISGKSGDNYIVQDPALSAGNYYPHSLVDRMYAY